MSTMASQITSHTIVYSSVFSGADQRKHQSSASLAFVSGIHRWPVNSPHKGPVTRKMFPFDNVIMNVEHWRLLCCQAELTVDNKYFRCQWFEMPRRTCDASLIIYPLCKQASAMWSTCILKLLVNQGWCTFCVVCTCMRYMAKGSQGLLNNAYLFTPTEKSRVHISKYHDGICCRFIVFL